MLPGSPQSEKGEACWAALLLPALGAGDVAAQEEGQGGSSQDYGINGHEDDAVGHFGHPADGGDSGVVATPFHRLPRADVGAKHKGKDPLGPVEVAQDRDEYDRLGDVVAKERLMPAPLEPVRTTTNSASAM